MQTVKIDRATWRSGGLFAIEALGETRLLNDEGLRCCLGFHASQLCGIDDSQMIARGCPRHVDGEIAGLVTSLGLGVRHDSDFASRAMRINDMQISEPLRERKLRALAQDYGYDYVFTGETPPEWGLNLEDDHDTGQS